MSCAVLFVDDAIKRTIEPGNLIAFTESWRYMKIEIPWRKKELSINSSLFASDKIRYKTEREPRDN